MRNKRIDATLSAVQYYFFLILSFILVAFLACDLPHQPGPMPTDIIDTQFERGLNILGVVRLDDSTGTSFVRVERAYGVEEMSEDFSPLVPDAEVIVRGSIDTTGHLFAYHPDTARGDLYIDPGFTPLEGEEYSLTVTGHDLPELTASTVVPAPPAIDSSSLVLSQSRLSFDLLLSDDVGLYDVYFFLSHGSAHQRVANTLGDHIEVRFDISENEGKPLWVEIYGYDRNLSEYLSVSITIKPQTYQETVTTVTGGYGCFGSVSRSLFFLEER